MSRLRRAFLLLVPVLLCVLAAAPVAAAAPAFRLAPLGHRFEAPVWVGGAGNGSGTIYVAEQRGVIWQVAGPRRTLFLDLRSVVSSAGEQGLLSVAFAHDFRSSGRMFVWFTLPSGNGQVRQYRVRDGAVVAGSGRVIINVPLSPPHATNHNGGQLWSRPDGTLLLSIGDGGGSGDPAGNAQRLDRLTGKILRITPRAIGGYLIPRSNPYFTRSGARREIWALGLRNPWRFSIDGATGDMWIGDVGQGDWEEIDRLPRGRPAGANFGWPRLEGNMLFNSARRLALGTPYMRPRLVYDHSDGECSVTGGLVYRGPVVALRGWYLYADFCTDEVHALHPGSGRHVTRAAVGGIVHFGAGRGADVYVASLSGRVYRIVAS